MTVDLIPQLTSEEALENLWGYRPGAHHPATRPATAGTETRHQARLQKGTGGVMGLQGPGSQEPAAPHGGHKDTSALLLNKDIATPSQQGDIPCPLSQKPTTETSPVLGTEHRTTGPLSWSLSDHRATEMKVG